MVPLCFPEDSPNILLGNPHPLALHNAFEVPLKLALEHKPGSIRIPVLIKPAKVGGPNQREQCPIVHLHVKAKPECVAAVLVTCYQSKPRSVCNVTDVVD